MEKNSGKLERIKGLDSLRFFAFLMVFLFHTSDKFFFGFLGVDFFFVLSSFLLTYLAFQEFARTGDFSKRNFFIRRVLRIFPLYYFIVILGLLVLPMITAYLKIDISLPEDKFLFWIFLSNYDTSKYLLPLEFLWSISVEEQFYLLFLMLSLFFWKRFWWVTAFLLLVYFAYFFIDQHYGWEHYKSLFFHFPNFAFGMAGGYLFFRSKFSRNKQVLFFGISSILILLTPVKSSLFNICLSIWFVSLIYLTALISELISENKIFKLSEYLGKYTYGLYIYSGFVIVAFNKFIPVENQFLKICMELLMTFFIAFISYHLFEKQFLKLKRKFRFSEFKKKEFPLSEKRD